VLTVDLTFLGLKNNQHIGQIDEIRESSDYYDRERTLGNGCDR
jgi:hypothetical protein